LIGKSPVLDPRQRFAARCISPRDGLTAKALKYGDPPPSGLSADERHAYEQLDFFYKHGLGYAIEMGNRPQTLYAIADSPIGLAAWILDHDARSYALIARAFDGHPGGLARDDILDNITLYWLTNTAISSGRLYWENKLAFFDPKNVSIPVAVSVLPDEIRSVLYCLHDNVVFEDVMFCQKVKLSNKT